MSVESEEDRDVLLADFGGTVTVVATGLNFTGIFDNDYLALMGMESRNPMVMCKSSDVTTHSIAQGTALTIGGVSYKVVMPQPDGTGMTVLELERQ